MCCGKLKSFLFSQAFCVLADITCSRRVKGDALSQVKWHDDPDVTLTHICRKMSLKLELSVILQSKYSIWGMRGGEYCSQFF